MLEVEDLVKKLKEAIRVRCVKLGLTDTQIRDVIRGAYSKLYTSKTSKPSRGKKPSVAIRAYYAGRYISLKRTTREDLFPVMRELAILYRIYKPLIEHKKDLKEILENEPTPDS